MSGSTSIRLLALAAVAAALPLLGGAGHAAPNTTFAGGGATLADCCNNSGAVTGTPSTATPYPLTINVASGVTTVGRVSATVKLDAQWPDDVQLLLVNPSASAKVLLMANVGGDNGNALSPDTLVFDDTGPTIPDNTQLKSGTYKPTGATDADCDNQSNPSNFPAPAPAGPYGSALSAFNGSAAYGNWKLYAIDDCSLANVGGSIVSWSVDITGPTAVTLRSFTAYRGAGGVRLRWRTAAETDALGFNVYRSASGKQIKVNRRLIAAKRSGTTRGASYGLVDTRAGHRSRITYRLQVISVRGARSWVANAAAR